MKFYSFDEIHTAANCRDIVSALYGITINGSGRCAAVWRGGTNPASVSVDAKQWYDHGTKTGGGAIELAAIHFGGDKQAAQEWLGDRYSLTPKMVTGEAPARGKSRYDKLIAEGYREVARYEYRALNGDVRHLTVRMEHESESKAFTQGHPNPNDPSRITWSLRGVETILYRLPEIAASPWVLICEGEKSADRIAALGIPATTAPMGAGKWQTSYSETLRGKHVSIAPDNDNPGRDHAQTVARDMQGIAASVRIIDSWHANMPEKAGIDDWVDKGNRTAEDINSMIASATDWAPPEDSTALSGDHYDIARKEYLVKSSEGRFLNYNENQYKRVLKSRDVSGRVPKGEQLSEIDRVILETQDKRCVIYSGALAGWPAGVHRIDNGRILITESPRFPEPSMGEFPHLAEFIATLFDHDQAQLAALFGWIKVAYESARAGKFRPGQALAICGVRDCGKSLMQSIITHILGGRIARPYMYMVGKTDFNADLFDGEHLIIEDDVPSSSISDRRAFGAKIKEFTANQVHRLHAKGRNAVMLPVFWRLSITVNDEPENLMILPPIDESLGDKITILRASPAVIPVDTSSHDGRDECWRLMVSEIPAFLAWLTDWEIPFEWRSGRYGIREYHHPDIMETLAELSPESKLAQLIDQAIFTTLMPADWTGTAAELEQALTTHPDIGYEARRLLSYNTACGVYLARLSNKYTVRYQRVRHATRNEWIIKPPQNPENPSTPSTTTLTVEGVEGFYDFKSKSKCKRKDARESTRENKSENPSTPSTPSMAEIVPF